MLLVSRDVLLSVFVLLGAPNIGRRSLKTRLLSEYSTRFGEVRAREYSHIMYIHVACSSTLIHNCSINWNYVNNACYVSSPEVLEEDIKIENSVTAPVPCMCIVYSCTLCVHVQHAAMLNALKCTSLLSCIQTHHDGPRQTRINTASTL